jgi:hypothetical protein
MSKLSKVDDTEMNQSVLYQIITPEMIETDDKIYEYIRDIILQIFHKNHKEFLHKEYVTNVVFNRLPEIPFNPEYYDALNNVINRCVQTDEKFIFYSKIIGVK